MRAARVDANQGEIVLALVSQGWSVQSLAGVGCGCPDILVGAGGVNVLLELKTDEKKKLTKHQVVWHRNWQGQVARADSPQEAVVEVLTAIGRETR